MARSLLNDLLVNVSLFSAAAALDANSRWQEVIADNLASSSVPGYKQQQLSQAAVQSGLMSANGAANLPQVLFHLQNRDFHELQSRRNEIHGQWHRCGD